METISITVHKAFTLASASTSELPKKGMLKITFFLKKQRFYGKIAIYKKKGSLICEGDVSNPLQ